MPPLVTTDWLALRLSRPDLVVIDASVIKVVESDGSYVRRSALLEFEASGHIPGARYADLIHDFSEPGAKFEFTRPGIRRMEAAAGALGLSARSRIVVYDTADGIWAARLWWLLRSYGHEDVSVLDGGFRKWVAEERPVALGTAFIEPADFQAVPQPGFFVDKADVIEVLEGRAEGALFCVLRSSAFSGAEKVYARPGHIPGSASMPYVDLLDDRTNAFRPPAALRDSLTAALEDGKRIILYCGGGVTAAGSALALATLGVSDVTVYDGSLSEWSADEDLPLVSGLA